MNPKKHFSYEEAVALFPEVKQLTENAVTELDSILAVEHESDVPAEVTEAYQRVVTQWADSMLTLGAEVKGLWLIDFDSGSGYYCWHYPESSLQHFHGYDEGFPGRVKLN